MADSIRIEGEMTDEEGYWWGLSFTEGPLSIELFMGYELHERWTGCLEGLAHRHRSSVGWKGFQASITNGGDFVLRSEDSREEAKPNRAVFVWRAPAASVLPQLSTALRLVGESLFSNEPLEYSGPKTATASDAAVTIMGSLAADGHRRLSLRSARFTAELTMGPDLYSSWAFFARDESPVPPDCERGIDWHGLHPLATLDEKEEFALRSDVDSFDDAGRCEFRWHAPMTSVRPALVSALAEVSAASVEWEDDRLSQGLAILFPAE